ncbi:MAG: RNase adapter RapZ, partial [Acetobacteraceae bacterium]
MSDPAAPRQVVLVTGLSGAGKASILRGLEDLGFETVDNPPWPVLERLLDAPSGRPLAAGVDARTSGFDPASVAGRLGDLRARGLSLDLVFATADDDALLRRYSETRRRHPLAPSGRVAEGIARERALLAPLLPLADWVVDTTALAAPDLRRMIEGRYGAAGLSITVQSFAFPRGLPREADIVLDLRFLRNPHYDPALRPLTGKDPGVAAHVMADPDFEPFWR